MFFFLTVVLPFVVQSLPDLIIDRDQLQDSAQVTAQWFSPNDCEIVEECIHGSGLRTLLRFDGLVANIGDSNLELGDPDDSDNPNQHLFSYHDCHEHYHFNSWMIFNLLNATTHEFITKGGKHGFCLEDSGPYWDYNFNTSDYDPDTFANYSCDFQGISAGWYDLYSKDLDCQYIDITDLPTGSYLLEAIVNNGSLVAESNTSNNKVYIEFEWNGDNNLSNYTTTIDNYNEWLMYIKYWNSNVTKLINYIPYICLTLVEGDLCTNETALVFAAMDNTTVNINVIPNSNSLNLNNGYFEVSSIYSIEDTFGCIFNITTYDVLFYDINGSIVSYNMILDEIYVDDIISYLGFAALDFSSEIWCPNLFTTNSPTNAPTANDSFGVKINVKPLFLIVVWFCYVVMC